MILRKMINLFNPAAHLPEINDAALVAKKYKYWRVRMFYSMYIGYLFYYFSRKSFTFITPFLCTDLGFTKTDVGILASVLSITYGVSKFASGILCDRSNTRYIMSIGLILTGLFNILFGCFSSLMLLSLFWGLNGWFQGWGWPACTKKLTYWYSRTERGSWWSACTTSHTVGGVLIALLAANCGKWYGWRFGMFVPGVLCIMAGFWLMNRLRDVPQSLGLPPIEKFKNEPEVESENSNTSLSIKEILLNHVLNNKYVWVLSLSYFFIYVVRTAVNDWGNLYLIEVKGYTPVSAAASVALFDVGGFFGILFAGWGSDYWFQGRRVPLMVITSVILVLAITGLWYLVPGQFWAASFLMAFIGFLVFGPQMLVGLAAAEFVNKKAASTSHGFAGCFAYLGAASAGYPLMQITETWKWYGFVVTLAICSAMAVLVLLPIWSAKTGEPVEEETFSLVREPVAE